MNPRIDTVRFQLGVPPDYEDAAEAEEEADLLRELAAEARAYVEAFPWAPPIADLLLAFGVGRIIAVFLVRFARGIGGKG